MSDARTMLNLALVGFMGTGKSVIGRLVADQLRFAFIDTDDLIQNEVGQSISEIFATQGEAAFRKYEKDVVIALSARRDTVIATGGGLVADADNLASLKSHSLVVCLWASPETIWERVRSQSSRPMLQAPDPQAKIRELLEKRGPAYRQADVLIHTGLRSVREAAEQILHQFHMSRA